MTSDDLDYALALSLQQQLDEQFTQERKYEERRINAESETKLQLRYDPKLVVDERWELLDPHPNVHDIFVQFDAMFFERKLVNAGVEVRWSPRMTLCAGVCSYEGRGGLCSVRLSVPLLKLRPRKDLVETLLHEMIHALLFVTENNTDHDGHGPNFCFHMKRINSLTGANITIYHTFHQEVNQYRQHWWRCCGPCRNRPPFYGWVKRAMNRAPSPKDRWWSEHQRSCGGSYVKVKEPENYGKKKGKGMKVESIAGEGSSVPGRLNGRPSGCKDIKEMMKKDKNAIKSGSIGAGKPRVSKDGNGSSSKVFDGEGHSLLASGDVTPSKQPTSQSERRQKLLEAAEKRRQISQIKGVKRKNFSDYHDIREFCLTPTSQNKVKRPKLNPAMSHDCVDDTCRYNIASSSNNCRHESANSDISYGVSPNSSMFSPASGDNSYHMVDLVSEDSSEGSDGEDQEAVVVIDDDHRETGDVPIPLRMCPVCGCTDIPLEIINTHVAQCLDEEETAAELE